MTEIERLERDIGKVVTIIENLKKTITKLEEIEGQLVLDLNRARRLEREAKELQS